MSIIQLDDRKEGKSHIIKLVNVRLSFPHLFTARAFKKDQEPKFQATFLLDPSDAEHAKIIAEIKKQANLCLKEVFGAKPPNSIKNGLCYFDGDTKDYEGYEGMWCIQASSKTRPHVVDRDKTPLSAADGKPYAGCYVDATLTLWILNNPEFQKRIVGELRTVQFRRDGESFSGQTAVDYDEEFEDLDDGDEGNDNFLDDDGGDDDNFLD